MNSKKSLGISGLVSLSALAVAALLIKVKYQEKRRQKISQEVRQFFSKMGEIEVVYFNLAESHAPELRGGLVMSDGRSFTFTYKQGEIAYEEEKE
ncbi:DUF4651 domain-containing protein [Streptococcus catagoni]|uniref:DUF4651 domain-containing protein n=1 Tax=Streptococcus catagoni TaxID=2654874 RepID=UPI001408466E|nr:DUF4651 domain-containing protein [Streptococcus catagoni]